MTSLFKNHAPLIGPMCHPLFTFPLQQLPLSGPHSRIYLFSSLFESHETVVRGG